MQRDVRTPKQKIQGDATPKQQGKRNCRLQMQCDAQTPK